MGRAGGASAAVAAGVVIGLLLAGPARAQSDEDTEPDPASVLLSSIGSGFVLDESTTGPEAGGYRRSFTHPSGDLSLFIGPAPPGLQPIDMARNLAGIDLGLDPIDITGLDGGFAFGGGSVGGPQGTVLVFPSQDAVFVFNLTTEPGAPWEADPAAFLVDLANRQLDVAGRPVEVAEAPLPAEIERYLADEPPPGYELQRAAVTGFEEVAEDVRGDPEVVETLNRESVTGIRLWLDPQGTAGYAVSVTRYPFDLFAAIELGTFERGRYLPTSIDGLSGQPGVRTFEIRDDDVHIVGAAFRRDRLSFTVLGTGTDRGAIESLVAAATAQHLELAPEGATGAVTIPSPARSLVQSFALVGATAIGVLGVRALRGLRHRRRFVARPAMAATTIDVAGEAARRRRGAIGMAAVQIAAWAGAIVGVAADLPNWSRLLIVAAAVAVGWGGTAWWRRRDTVGDDDGVGAPRARPPRPDVGDLVLVVAGFALLVAGLALVIWGMRERLFRPSLTHLRFSDAVGVEPRLLAIVIVGVGAALVVLATAVLRRARARARATAAELRARDPRPPLLYLRSFADDDVLLPTVLSPRRPFVEMFSLRTADPFEESLAWELGSYGPVVAVGRPGTAPDSLGAAREFLPDDSWQDGVLARMAAALAIVVVAGDTPGLEWEVAAIADRGHLGKTVFVIPPVAELEATARWAATLAPLPGAAAEALRGVDPASALTAQLGAGGAVATVGRRNDEADYRVAIDRAMAIVRQASTPNPVGATSP